VVRVLPRQIAIVKKLPKIGDILITTSSYGKFYTHLIMSSVHMKNFYDYTTIFLYEEPISLIHPVRIYKYYIDLHIGKEIAKGVWIFVF